MRKTGSELISEMVGPAGSTSEGAFSRAYAGEEEEFCPGPEELEELALEDWARAEGKGRAANRQRRAAERTAEDGDDLNVMENPVQF
jgi:hypothetical protein